MQRFIRAGLMIFMSLAVSQPACANDEAANDVLKTRVAILMFDGVQIIDFAAPYEVFGQASFEVYTVSKDGNTVTTAMNLSVNVDHNFESAPPADIVLVPGGKVHDVMEDEATLAWIRARTQPAEHVLSICTGSYILASTGLLDGKQATTFHKAFDGMTEQFPDITVVRDQRWVDAGKLVTSAGLASGIDAALHVVAEVLGETQARSVALHLEYDWSPNHGFVRGRLADQYTRMPENGMQFPEGTVIDRDYGVGDERYWEERYRINSSWSAVQLLDHLREQATHDEALEVLPLPDRNQLAWQYRSERGGQWRASYQVTETLADGSYRIVSKLMRLD